MSKGRQPLYIVRTSDIHGRGVFAARRIRKGTRIVEYEGERIDNDEADRRYDETGMKRHHTFLFTLDKKTVIDGAIKRGGGDASYIKSSLWHLMLFLRGGPGSLGWLDDYCNLVEPPPGEGGVAPRAPAGGTAGGPPGGA